MSTRPLVVVASDRRVTVDGPDLSCYQLARAWLCNNPSQRGGVVKTRHTGRLQLPPLEKEAVPRQASLRRLPSRGRAPTGSEYMRQAVAEGADIEEHDMDEEVFEEGEGEGEGELEEGDAEAARPLGDDRAMADEAPPDGASLDDAGELHQQAGVAVPLTHAEERATEAGLGTAAVAEAGAEAAVKAEAGVEGGVEAGANTTTGQLLEQAGSGDEPPLDADSEGTLLSDRGQPGSTALSRADSSLGDEPHSTLAAEEWANASRSDDAPSADDGAKANGASGEASQVGEAPRAANGQRTITPDEILDMHVAHFRDVRRFAQAQYQRSLRQHQGRLATILRVQSREPNDAVSSGPARV